MPHAWGISAFGLMLIASIGCSQAEPAADPATAAARGPRLVNEEWNIIRMGATESAFVIEVEAQDPSRAMEIARELVPPVQNRYDEILVYVQGAADEGAPRRVRWTPSGGYEDSGAPAQ